jgi:RNA polymerase sigma-70 factor (ECF subfamily)
MAEGGPDWPQIAALYDILYRMEPTPVIALNRAVALAETGDVPRALALVETLGPELSDYQPFHAARAALLARVGRIVDSRAAYDLAISLSASAKDAAFLVREREKLPVAGQPKKPA